MKLKLFIIVIFTTLFFTNCKDNFSFLSKTERLTRRTWVISSMIDHKTNESLSFIEATYNFKSDGTLITNFYTQNIQDTSEWKFMYDEEYIKVGSNVFKITTLTQKIMSLKYGTIDIYYVPYE